MNHGVPTAKTLVILLLAIIAAAVVVLAVRSFHKNGVTGTACVPTATAFVCAGKDGNASIVDTTSYGR